MSPVRRLIAGLLWTWMLSISVAAMGQPAQHESEELGVRVYTLKYQQAVGALGLIQGLLSPRGTLELQPGSNTLVIRDTMSSLARIVPVLHDYDHPARAFRLEIQIVRVSRGIPVSPQVRSSDLPEGVTRRLRELFHYDVFDLLASADFIAQEGQQVVYNLRDDYEVRFRLGWLTNGEIALTSFRFSKHGNKKPGAAPGLNPNLNLTKVTLVIDSPLFLGLARGEASPEALMIGMTAHAVERPRAE